MSVYTKIEKAESLIREALINALAEGDDQHLSDLFNLLNNIKETLTRVADTAENNSRFAFNLSSDYLQTDRIGKDLDALDDITFAAGSINIPGAAGTDIIDFSDYKSQEYRPD